MHSDDAVGERAALSQGGARRDTVVAAAARHTPVRRWWLSHLRRVQKRVCECRTQGAACVLVHMFSESADGEVAVQYNNGGRHGRVCSGHWHAHDARRTVRPAWRPIRL